MRIAYWVSCGTASAVNAKLGLAKYRDQGHEIRLLRCLVPEEHPDNDRFAADLVRWFNWPIENIKSNDYESCEDVWRRRRYMSGPHGAPCTIEMKKSPRWEIEKEWWPDIQSFGYTADEQHRVDRFRNENPEINIVSHLIESGLDKDACHAIVSRAGIRLPQSYLDGFPNANCRGCVRMQAPKYWNLTRRIYPEVFDARATLSRELGVRLVKGTSGDRERIFLDELDPDAGMHEPMPPSEECSLLCYAAEQAMVS